MTKKHSKSENGNEMTVINSNQLPFTSLYDCEVCAHSFDSKMALHSHQRAKGHGKYSNISSYKIRSPKRLPSAVDTEIKDYKKAVFNSMDSERTQLKKMEELKSALREQLAIDDRPYYNVEAYQLAIRTMSISEAYKLAKDEMRSSAIIESHKNITDSTTAVPAHTLTQDVIEQAKFTDRTAKMRINQGDFSKRVAFNFNFICSITASSQALEAAHIDPVSTGNNNTSNGVLMLACLHRLFDAGYMAINPETLTVHFSSDCNYFAKEMLEGKVLAPHHTPLNKSGLMTIWNNFKSRDNTLLE